MPKRSQDWNKGLAKDLKDPEFAMEFILSAVEEGMSLQQVLGKVIRCYGIKEFAKKVRIPSSNVSRAINPKHNPTQKTLNKLLKPFGLKLTVAPIEEEAA